MAKERDRKDFFGILAGIGPFTQEDELQGQFD